MKTANDPEDLQDLAIAGDGKTGGFTYDELYRWSSVFEETNGIDGAQHDDFHAISSAYGSIPLNALPYAWDLNFVNTNSDGSHEYNIVGNTKITNAITKAQLLLCNSLAKGVSNYDNTGNCSLGGYSEPITHFAENKSIFALHLLYTSEDDNEMIREMYSEFGLLPLPKYNANQLNYGTTAHDSYTLITVIDHSESSIPTKGEAISAYLQMSNAESYTNVRGFYINRIVKPKYFGTDDTNGSVSKSIQIFNIIAENIEFDFLSVYAPQLNGVLNNCWKDVITWQNDAGALSAEEAYWADQANFDSCIAEVDRWLGIS